MARFVWQETGMRKVGNNDSSISPYLKCWIKQGNTCVTGVIGDGTSKDLTANWQSPFEGDAIGSKHSKTGGLLQTDVIGEASGGRFSTDGMTSITSLSSRQVWSGNQPHTFNLTLNFHALSDPKAEVEDAIQELEMMASPELKAMLPVGGQTATGNSFGRVPDEVWLNIGRNVVIGPCVITNISVPLDGPRSRDGYLVSAQVNVGIQSFETLNRSQIPATYG